MWSLWQRPPKIVGVATTTTNTPGARCGEMRCFAAFAEPAAGSGQSPAAGRSLALVYDHDAEEVAALGWEEFIARQWESIFIGYRSNAGLRRICRRWSDLLEAGLGRPHDVAGPLVRHEIVDRAARDLEGIADPANLVVGMTPVLADGRSDLLGRDGAPDGLLDSHARLVGFIRAYAFGPDAGELPA